MAAASESQTAGIQPQDRDIALLRGLFESRIMTGAQVAILYFGGKREYAKKRLQKLKAAGLITERRRQMNEPSILFLTRKAFSLLNQTGELSRYPKLGVNSFQDRTTVSEFTLRHEVEVMDVKAAFYAALADSPKFSIVEFCTWPLLCEFRARRPGYGNREILVRPDGFLRIHEKEEGGKGFFHECFLEVDRSSETQETLVSRAACYLDYYRSGGFAIRNGGHPADFKEYPFRVLIVLKSAERRNNTAERLIRSEPPILSVSAHENGPTLRSENGPTRLMR
jgi:hypothetical protein